MVRLVLLEFGAMSNSTIADSNLGFLTDLADMHLQSWTYWYFFVLIFFNNKIRIKKKIKKQKIKKLRNLKNNKETKK